MKMKKLLALLLALTMALSLAACGGGDDPAPTSGGNQPQSGQSQPKDDDTVYTWITSCNVREDDPIAQSVTYFADILEEKSGGRIKTTVYYNGEFGVSDGERLQMCMENTIQFVPEPGFIMAPYADNLKVFYVDDYPFIYENYEQLYTWWDSDLCQEILDLLPEALGVYGFPAYSMGYNNITTVKKPFSAPDDIKGMKIRSALTPLYVAALESFGAEVASIEWAETYTAMQQGVCDGMSTSTSLYITANLFEVVNYLCDVGYSHFLHYGLTNCEWYDALPADLQDIYDECVELYQAESRRINEAGDAGAMDRMRSEGVECYIMSDAEKQVWMDKAMSVYQNPEYVDMVGEDFLRQVLTIVGKEDWLA